MTSAIAGFRTSEKQRDKHENTRYTAAVAAAPQQTAARNKLLPTTGQVQNVANSRVYVFGNSDLAEDELNSVPSSEDFIEMSELRPRAGKVKNKKKNVDQRKEAEPIFIEREIESGDSLQIFSLQYGCPVSELKRCNNLMNDQDFFALRRIKIPVKQHGLLTETEEERRRRPNATQEAKSTGNNLTNGFLSGDDDFESDDEEDQFVRTISIRDSMRDNISTQQFLKNMDRDLEKICQATKTQKESLEEVTSVLTETRIHPLLLPYFQRKKKRTYCDETSCGMTWKSVFMVVILVAVAIPILIGIYFYFEKGNDDSSGSTSSLWKPS
ncbi:lysM and putative peptidoglycan-binding domain-containing protein 3-like [Asterias amurensis]|uniref:lysM and putative peptidoglycan-binding domain-containing protein 3-like n=1 Tax=Asterias amurensis TaxID=7602 RepID=UPI003AB3D1C4